MGIPPGEWAIGNALDTRVVVPCQGESAIPNFPQIGSIQDDWIRSGRPKGLFVAQVFGMTVSTQTVAPADLADLLPDVQLQVRQGGTRTATYPLDGVDFLIGAVSGCDLRVAA